MSKNGQNTTLCYSTTSKSSYLLKKRLARWWKGTPFIWCLLSSLFGPPNFLSSTKVPIGPLASTILIHIQIGQLWANLGHVWHFLKVLNCFWISIWYLCSAKILIFTYQVFRQYCIMYLYKVSYFLNLSWHRADICWRANCQNRSTWPSSGRFFSKILLIFKDSLFWHKRC